MELRGNASQQLLLLQCLLLMVVPDIGHLCHTYSILTYHLSLWPVGRTACPLFLFTLALCEQWRSGWAHSHELRELLWT